MFLNSLHLYNHSHDQEAHQQHQASCMKGEGEGRAAIIKYSQGISNEKLSNELILNSHIWWTTFIDARGL